MTPIGDPPLPSPATLVVGRRPLTLTDAAIAATLWVATFTLFIPTARYSFINFDDPQYVSDNPTVRRGLTWDGIGYAFTHRVVGNWHPLTLLVSEALSRLFGPSPATFHVSNTVLHAVAVVLLFAVLRTATGRRWPAAVAAALWGLHPLRVESVAWVAELKDELSSVTCLACLLAYVAYAARRSVARYGIVLGLYALAVLAKPTAVTLPAVLLLLDYWPLGRDPHINPTPARYWRDRLLEKLPLLSLAAATAVAAVGGQSSPSVLVQFPLAARLSNAAVSVAAYLRQTAWPTGLALFYPHPLLIHRPPSILVVAASAALIVLLTAVALAAARRRPYVTVGWFWFLGVLLPNVGLLQAGLQARADRFTLLPAIGLTIAVVWSAADWAATGRNRLPVAAIAATMAVLAFASATRRLLPTWQNAETVWERADAVVTDNYVARAFLSTLATDAGDPVRGERLARQSIAIAPTVMIGHVALVDALLARHDPAAVLELAPLVRADPNNARLRYRSATALLQAGDAPAARAQAERALQLDPNLIAAHELIGTILTSDGDYPGAADHFEQYLAAAPHTARVEGELADALRRGSVALPVIDRRATPAALSKRPSTSTSG